MQQNTNPSEDAADSSIEKEYKFKKYKSFFSAIFKKRKKDNSLKSSIQEVIEEQEAKGEIVDGEEKAMIENVLSFNEMKAEDVMVPRTDIAAISYDISTSELKELLLNKNLHTRIPVYEKDLDNIRGFLHIKDTVAILAGNKKKDLKDILRHILFVPPSMKASTLLVKMKMSRVHIAVVIDEYGGTSGLVTMEDIMEIIVGEIEDEHDKVQDYMFEEVEQNIYQVSARVEIEDIEERLHIKLRKDEDDDYDTLGGLIFSILGRIPTIGEVVNYEDKKNGAAFEFEIVEADTRRVKKIMMKVRL